MSTSKLTRNAYPSTSKVPSASSVSEAVDAVGRKNLENVRNIVRMKQNPHPITVIVGFLVSLLLVYIFWILVCGSTPQGTWVDNVTGKKYWIDHGKLSGSINIWCKESGDVLYGKLRGYVLVLGDHGSKNIGIWSENEIFWTDTQGQMQIWKRQLTCV